ncbi:peroxiredoxin [soil metagenome]
MSAKVGEKAPDFELPGSGGKSYKLADYAGKGVILAFYPGDFTAVCTKQFCSYRDNSDKIDSLGVELLGVSPQSVDSHERFIQEESLNVPLLADEEKTVSKDYGVLGPGGFVRRAIFVIDGDLVIRYRDVKLLGLSYEDPDELQKAVAVLS